jgi:hypothetical protein
MAGFDECSLWTKLAFLAITIGFVLDLFGMSMGNGSDAAVDVMMQAGAAAAAGNAGGSYPGHRNDKDGLLVTGFLLFLGAAALLLVMVHLDEMKGNKIGLICFGVMAVLAGLLTVIGIAVWLGHCDGWKGSYNVSDSIPPYGPMVGCIGSLLAILSAIFAVLELVGVKAGGSGGGRGGGSGTAAAA